MKKHTLLVFAIAVATTGCMEESNGGTGGSSGGSQNYTLGWGVNGSSFSAIKAMMNAVADVTLKTTDDGAYVDRSQNFAGDCTGRPAYESEHFEVAAVSDGIPLSDIQRITAIAEVNLQMIADELGVNTTDLIINSHNNRLGICINEGKGSTGGGHGTELILNQSNPYGGTYEYTLHKHELGHVIDSQFNHNQYGYNLYPAWWTEGIADVIAGVSPLSLSSWKTYHGDYVGSDNMIERGSANDGGYKAYPLYSTTVLYLANQGWGDESYLHQFFQLDKWHTDNTSGPYPCPIVDYVTFTGDCQRPFDADDVFEARFNEVSMAAGGEVTSFAYFKENYKTLIENWLANR